MTNYDHTTHVMRYEQAMKAVRGNLRRLRGLVPHGSRHARNDLAYAARTCLENARRIREVFLWATS